MVCNLIVLENVKYFLQCKVCSKYCSMLLYKFYTIYTIYYSKLYLNVKYTTVFFRQHKADAVPAEKYSNRSNHETQGMERKQTRQKC